jgi:hypothetical protein
VSQLNRMAAADAVVWWRDNPATMRELADRLEQCVVEDPRLARIKALCDAADKPWPNGGPSHVVFTKEIRAILRGDR